MRFPPMRLPFTLLTAGLFAGQLLLSPIAQAECLRPADHASFDITALKTQLMVTALTCSADERYNAFVRKFQPVLATQDKVLNGYFTRANGRNARRVHDDYVTQLANSRSQEGTRQGGNFCSYNVPVFDEVMALRTGAELESYAAGRSVQQPISVAACGAATTARPAAVRGTGRAAPARTRRS